MNVQGVMELFGTLFKLSYHSNISKPNSSPYFFLSFFLLSFFLSFFLLCSYNFYSVTYAGSKCNSLFLSCPCPESIYYRDHFFKVSPECICFMMGSLAKYLCHLSFLFSFQGHPKVLVFLTWVLPWSFSYSLCLLVPHSIMLLFLCNQTKGFL